MVIYTVQECERETSTTITHRSFKSLEEAQQLAQCIASVRGYYKVNDRFWGAPQYGHYFYLFISELEVDE